MKFFLAAIVTAALLAEIIPVWALTQATIKSKIRLLLSKQKLITVTDIRLKASASRRRHRPRGWQQLRLKHSRTPKHRLILRPMLPPLPMRISKLLLLICSRNQPNR